MSVSVTISEVMACAGNPVPAGGAGAGAVVFSDTIDGELTQVITVDGFNSLVPAGRDGRWHISTWVKYFV